MKLATSPDRFSSPRLWPRSRHETSAGRSAASRRPSPTARVKRPAGFADNPCCTWDALRAMPDVHSQFMSQLTTAKEMQWSHSEKYLERLSRAFNMVSVTAAYVEDVLYVLHEDVLEHDDYVETLRNVAFTLRGVAELNLEERDLIVTEMLSLGTDDEDLVRSMVEEKHRIDSASYHLTTASTRDLIISMQRAQAKAVVEAEKKILAKQAAERRLARKKKAKKLNMDVKCVASRAYHHARKAATDAARDWVDNNVRRRQWVPTAMKMLPLSPPSFPLVLSATHTLLPQQGFPSGAP